MDSRDNHEYKWVTIGTQTWMAENLNYDCNVEEDLGCFCYEGKEENCQTYGRMYNYFNASLREKAPKYEEIPSGVKGNCPEGWHMPSNSEWDVLELYIGGESKVELAHKLKAKKLWDEVSIGVLEPYPGMGKDSYGFSVFGGGYGSASNVESSYRKGEATCFWTTTAAGGGRAYMKSIENDDKQMANIWESFAVSCYLRCVKDEE